MPIKIGIIIGSTRPGRNGEAVAKWVHRLASTHSDAEFEIVDLLDYNLPHLDEAIPASQARYAGEHTKTWASKVAEFDGYIFVTPEYNHSISGALKNAIDFVYAEWNNKAAGIVSYGGSGGARAAEHLRLILGELQIADVRAQVALSLRTDFESYSEFKPAPSQAEAMSQLIGQTIAWSGALKPLRAEAELAA